MAPALLASLLPSLGSRSTNGRDSVLSAVHSAMRLAGRDDAATTPTHVVPVGVIPPQKINNNAIFALFGLIGVAFVALGIWFFFWARNGGFVFREQDWDDYKTTVLRRRGPNGTLLSGATESTRLGGGSVYKDVDDDTSTHVTPTVVTGVTDGTASTLSGITAGVSDIGAREKRRRKREQRERERERRREEKAREKEEYDRRRKGKGKTGRKVGADGLLIDEEAEAAAKAQLRDYRHEKPARVGGLNKESEASEWDGSTNPSHSAAGQTRSGYTDGTESTVTSELMRDRERTPTSTPTKKTGGAGGIRKVYSTADKTEERERERLRAEAKKLQEKGRAARSHGEGRSSEPRRDFSYKQGDDSGAALRAIEEGAERSGGGGRSGRSRSRARASAARDEAESRVPGSWAESDVGTSSDLGTKVYHHSVHIPIPSATASSVSGTSTSDFAYQEEKRKRRQGAGYRRNRDG